MIFILAHCKSLHDTLSRQVVHIKLFPVNILALHWPSSVAT